MWPKKKKCLKLVVEGKVPSPWGCEIPERDEWHRIPHLSKDQAELWLFALLVFLLLKCGFYLLLLLEPRGDC